MANKKSKTADEQMNGVSSSDEDMDAAANSDSESGSDKYDGNEEIQVDFEGRNPIDSDFHGIRQLLHQMFLKANVNLSELSDFIIGQNYVGSVVIQSDIAEDDDDDDDITDSNVIFGITTVINLTAKKELGFVDQILTYILENSKRVADESIRSKIESMLNDGTKSIGYLINERFINIPPHISVPLFENLKSEIDRACRKKMPFNFDYFLMIIKFYRKPAKKQRPAHDVFSNSEEELMCNEAVWEFEWSVEAEADTKMAEDWVENEKDMVPYRRVILFEAKKLPKIIDGIKVLIES